DEVIEELVRIREEVGWPPLASPIGQFLGSQALLNVLSASRYSVIVDEVRALVEGKLGTPPGPIDPIVRRAAALRSDPASEEAGMRVSVRSFEDAPGAQPGVPLVAPDDLPPPLPTPTNGLVRVEAPMVGTFYRAPAPGAPPFVEEGMPVAQGQTLCILEAMKLMNEVKSDVEGIVRAIHVENAAPVEFGQLLFELEPVDGLPAL